MSTTAKYGALPSPEQERANAAYVWANHCQTELIKELGRSSSPIGKDRWPALLWHWGRLQAAVEAERAACEAMDVTRMTPPPPRPDGR